MGELPGGHEARVRRERDFYRRLLGLGREEKLEPFLEEALRLVVEMSGAQQGYLEVRDGDGAEWSTASGCSPHEVEDIRRHTSRGIVAESLATGETIVTQSALLDERFRTRESVLRERIQAVLCSPIGDSAALGVVYLQGRDTPEPFGEEDRELAEVFASSLVPYVDRLMARRRFEHRSDETRELRERFALDAIVGRSAALARALEQAMLAAPLDVTVLLTGAPGTGKTQLAHAIHANSNRSDGPFVELNCAALPETLIESELFGARAGSHSGATRDRPGKVSAAEGGTLFLDEIGELPLSAQAKLLQLLHSKQYYPLGATQTVQADVRVIAATNADLEQRVAERRFRDDLFYRLDVLRVRLPTLAERREDVRALAPALCDRVVARHGFPSVRLAPAAERAIEASEWPGNARQLENAIEAAVIRAVGEGAREVTPRHLFPEWEAREEACGERESFQQATRRFQKELIARALEENGWNVSETARRLEIARSYLYELIQGFELNRRSDDPE